MTPRRLPRPAVFVAAAATVLAACAEPPPAARPPSGSMDVLGPVPAFEPSALPADWVTAGPVGRGQLRVVERDGIPALMVVNGAGDFVAAKPTGAFLLATPYLSWAWNMEAPETGPHPVRLIVGLQGGNRQRRPSPKSTPPAAEALPVHDRAIVIAWGESALQRGAIVKPAAGAGPRPPSRYTARGGRENAGTWWLETVDLSDVYRRSWPGDDAASARITFIGVAASAGAPPSPAYLSGIRLSR